MTGVAIFGIALAIAVMCVGVGVLVVRTAQAIGRTAWYRRSEEWIERQPWWVRQLTSLVAVGVMICVGQIAFHTGPGSFLVYAIGTVLILLIRPLKEHRSRSTSQRE